MAYEIRDNEEQGLSRLPTQFDNSPLLTDYLRTYLKGVDGLSALANDYLEGVRINNAVGVQLDIAGQIVGEPRRAKSDADYRVAIKTRILINTSQGRPQDIYAAARALANTNTARFWEHPPASLIVAVGGENIQDIPQKIAGFIDQTASAGVSCDQVLVDTDNNGLVFAEIVFEEGTIITNTGDDLIDNTGDFIEYQLSTETVTNDQSAKFAEIFFDELVIDQTSGDFLEVNTTLLDVNGTNLELSSASYTLGGGTWLVTTVDPTVNQGNIFFEALI